ncbi:MAG: hypothetical protein RL748_4159 [Pseudomonadota bacterium]|jgi:protein AbiQ
MQLIKLDPSFHQDHTHLVQALDNHGGTWQPGKTRGYGIVLISIGNLTFGIPLRSNIQHKAAYLTARNSPAGNGPPYGKGLDFSKALLISNPSYISTEIFKIPPDEHKKLASKQAYIYAISRCDKNILNSNEYRHTTLQNYHIALGIQARRSRHRHKFNRH